jgi:DNA-binding transcriptional LysR family regulator
MTGHPAAPIRVRKIPVTDALLELVRSGAGVGVLDRWTIAHSVGRSIRALPLSPRASRTFDAVWRRSNPRGLPMRDLVALVTSHAGRAVTNSGH